MGTSEEKKELETQGKRSVQDYLSFGYLYLLGLGIIHDVIFYSFLDINILSYSTVIDVLLSPVNYLVSNKIIPIAIIVALFLIFLLQKVVGKLAEKEKKKFLEKGIEPKLDTKLSKFIKRNFFISTAAIGVFSMYLGAGVGGGLKISSSIKKKEIKMLHKIYFTDNEVVKARVIGNNTEYLFYVIDGETTVSISPIQSNIKKIENLLHD